jgi:hypothetical protein
MLPGEGEPIGGAYYWPGMPAVRFHKVIFATNKISSKKTKINQRIFMLPIVTPYAALVFSV